MSRCILPGGVLVGLGCLCQVPWSQMVGLGQCLFGGLDGMCQVSMVLVSYLFKSVRFLALGLLYGIWALLLVSMSVLRTGFRF